MAFLKRFFPLLSVALLLFCLLASAAYAASLEDPYTVTSGTVSLINPDAFSYGPFPGFPFDTPSDIFTGLQALMFNGQPSGCFFNSRYMWAFVMAYDGVPHLVYVSPGVYPPSEITPDTVDLIFALQSFNPSTFVVDDFYLNNFLLGDSFEFKFLYFGGPAPEVYQEVMPPVDESLIDLLGGVSGSFLSTCVGIADKIASTPLLLFTVGIFFLGGAVGIFGRILGRD